MIPQCHGPAVLKSGNDVYPDRADLKEKQFWVCTTCGSSVGCHPNTTTPLGTLASSEVRAARRRAHNSFDRLWQRDPFLNAPVMSRGQAYAWLSREMKIDPLHIGYLDEEQCQRVEALCDWKFSEICAKGTT